MLTLPTFLIKARSCGEAWIRALDVVYNEGRMMPQHYGNTDDERMSREATVLIDVHHPLGEPRYHAADYATYIECIRKPEERNYIAELLGGVIDEHVENGHLSYTYHRRIWNYGKRVTRHDELVSELGEPIMTLIKGGKTWNEGINQFKNLIKKAIDEPISRKLQVITWIPHKDMFISGTPCLQRLWFRLIPDGDVFSSLVLEAHFRSRDLFHAWGSNAYGLVELGKSVAKILSREMGMRIELTQYVDFSNSLHVYSRDFAEVENVFETIRKRRARQK